MNATSLLSIIITLIAIILAAISVYNSQDSSYKKSLNAAQPSPAEFLAYSVTMNQRLRNIEQSANAILEQRNTNEKQDSELRKELLITQNEIQKLQKIIAKKYNNTDYNNRASHLSIEEPETRSINIWSKLGFSVFLGIAALFVILSRKYKNETEKWAFSVLTLISGVWIGTI